MEQRESGGIRIERASANHAEAMACLWLKSAELLADIDPAQYAPPPGSEGFAAYLRAAIEEGTVVGFVAWLAGRVVGFIHGQILERHPPIRTSRCGYIAELYVEPDCRERGTGSALVGAFESWVQGEGLTQVELSSHLRSPLAQAFWERRGYLAYADFRRRELPAAR